MQDLGAAASGSTSVDAGLSCYPWTSTVVNDELQQKYADLGC
jgi:hypothetical protein